MSISNRAMIGTNLGGWMVLEPWITPSLFYRFLDKTHTDGVGIATHSFCEALGPTYGAEVLKEHWDTWITEDTFKDMAAREVEIIRLPIGDWTILPYSAYVGCTNAAQSYVDWALDMAHKYNIKVLLDVHGVKGSQNGFDNSGLANRTTWIDENNFEHDSIGEWMGPWDDEEQKYKEIDTDNIKWAKQTVQTLLDVWGDHPALYAIEPVNEPWGKSDLTVLKQFYIDVRNMMKARQPHLKFVFHDAFHWDPTVWNDMFADDDHENVVIDTHQYLAWSGRHEDMSTYCDNYDKTISKAKDVKYEVWVGEWSLATDVCALWLGGFNDASTDAQSPCQRVECPRSYLKEHAVDFDRTATKLGPYGQHGLTRSHSTIQAGTCAIDSAYFDDSQVMKLGQCILDTFNENVEAHFMWTVRNELEPRWNYITAYDNGWVKNK